MKQLILIFNILFLFTNSYAFQLSDTNRDISSSPLSLDISKELLVPNNQLNTPFCQTFAMISLLEYYWAKKYNTKIKFSEKYLVKTITLTILERAWNEETQMFNTDSVIGHMGFAAGNIGLSVILSAIEKYGIVPDSAFNSFKTVDDKEGFNIDLEQYNHLFRTNPETYNQHGLTLNKMKEYIETIFGSPTDFSLDAEYFSYSAFNDQIKKISDPMDLIKQIDFNVSDFKVVYNKSNYLENHRFFNPHYLENYFRPIELAFGNYFEESNTSEMLLMIEKSIDLGNPIYFTNKWLSKDASGEIIDTGGHVTLIVGYQKVGDQTWYRIKNSSGINPQLHEFLIDGTPIAIKRINGYDYIEKSSLEVLMTGIMIPSVLLN